MPISHTQHNEKTKRRRMVCAIREAERVLPNNLPGAFFLTDPKRVEDLVGIVERLPNNCGVIYRHFGEAQRTETAKILRDITFRKRCPLLIANDPHLAAAITADGVHWPEKHVRHARLWKRKFQIQTSSAHGRRALKPNSIDAVLFSAVFSSNSSSASTPMGAFRFRNTARSQELAVYGLGGINGTNAGTITRCAGIAAIEGFLEI